MGRTARAGAEITGLDASPEMLAECRRRLDAEPESVRWRVRLVEGDMRDFSLGRSFALVTTGASAMRTKLRPGFTPCRSSWAR